MRFIDGLGNEYDVGDDHVGEFESFYTHLCSPITDRNIVHTLQLATSVEDNGCLDRMAYILKRFSRCIDRLAGKSGDDGLVNDILGYRLLYPNVISSGIYDDSERKRINILSFNNVPDSRAMVPIQLIIKNNQRVDPRTSVWIMGRLLKLLSWSHGMGVTVGNISTSNILIEPGQHIVVVFDWTKATIHYDKISKEDASTDIANAAESVIELLGNYPGDGDEVKYLSYLQRLADGVVSDASKAHAELYGNADMIWERSFYPFTALNRH